MAYDFIFFRRLVSKINLTASLYNTSGHLLRSSQQVISKSEFKQYGFKSQLERLFWKTLEEAVHLSLKDLLSNAK